ncbi:hypothetical protein BHE74_00029232 [Ensete ventricosum]|nr:hypothetical protein BHE74_00029232 [Ensete ventricosum]
MDGTKEFFAEACRFNTSHNDPFYIYIYIFYFWFLFEVLQASVLSRIHHRNLVGLVGFCKDNRVLGVVYEYVAQGSLRDNLKDKASGGLNWRQRLRIAIETASGLEYLHKGCRPPIIHRDVKTSNILLDHNLEAKIADFGLSKSFQTDANTHVSTDVVVGTPGYVDPE